MLFPCTKCDITIAQHTPIASVLTNQRSMSIAFNIDQSERKWHRRIAVSLCFGTFFDLPAFVVADWNRFKIKKILTPNSIIKQNSLCCCYYKYIWTYIRAYSTAHAIPESFVNNNYCWFDCCRRCERVGGSVYRELICPASWPCI